MSEPEKKEKPRGQDVKCPNCPTGVMYQARPGGEHVCNECKTPICFSCGGGV